MHLTCTLSTRNLYIALVVGLSPLGLYRYILCTYSACVFLWGWNERVEGKSGSGPKNWLYESWQSSMTSVSEKLLRWSHATNNKRRSSPLHPHLHSTHVSLPNISIHYKHPKHNLVYFFKHWSKNTGNFQFIVCRVCNKEK